MKPELKRRIERLEAEHTRRVVAWIDAPQSGLAGWEILSNNPAVEVWREEGETDEELQARAAAIANRKRGMIVCFGMDERGITR